MVALHLLDFDLKSLCQLLKQFLIVLGVGLVCELCLLYHAFGEELVGLSEGHLLLSFLLHPWQNLIFLSLVCISFLFAVSRSVWLSLPRCSHLVLKVVVHCFKVHTGDLHWVTLGLIVRLISFFDVQICHGFQLSLMHGFDLAFESLAILEEKMHLLVNVLLHLGVELFTVWP